MIQLYEAETKKIIGEISETQLQFLIEMLEEESSTDQDYYLDTNTLELFAASGAHPSFLEMLRTAIGDREGIEVRWEKKTEE